MTKYVVSGCSLQPLRSIFELRLRNLLAAAILLQILHFNAAFKTATAVTLSRAVCKSRLDQ